MGTGPKARGAGKPTGEGPAKNAALEDRSGAPRGRAYSSNNLGGNSGWITRPLCRPVYKPGQGGMRFDRAFISPNGSRARGYEASGLDRRQASIPRKHRGLLLRRGDMGFFFIYGAS